MIVDTCSVTCFNLRSAWDFSLLPLLASVHFLNKEFENCLRTIEKFETSEEVTRPETKTFLISLKVKSFYELVTGLLNLVLHQMLIAKIDFFYQNIKNKIFEYF